MRADERTPRRCSGQALLRLIAAVPAGEKLPLARFARELNASQPVVIALVERLIGDEWIDKRTLRPCAAADRPPDDRNGASGQALRPAASPPLAVSRRPTNGELHALIFAETKRRGILQGDASAEIFGNRNQVSMMLVRGGAVAQRKTIDKVRAWLDAAAPIDRSAGPPDNRAADEVPIDRSVSPPDCRTADDPQPSVGAARARAEAGGDPERQAEAAAVSPPFDSAQDRPPDHPTGEQLLAEIDAFVARVPGLSRARFGVAIGRRAICYRLETVRHPRPETAGLVRRFIADPPDMAPYTADSPSVSRSKREEMGLPPSLKAITDSRAAREQSARREREEEALSEAEVARATRRAGETLADAVRREARDREDRFREATRLTTRNPISAPARPHTNPLAEAEEDDPDVGAVAAHRRQRELEELTSPSSVLRLAQRDWPDQCAKVKAIAAEMGVGLGEAWRQVISAGVMCLAEAEEAG